MKILLSGGGTGGHFYPLIAVARALREVAEREKIINIELKLAASKPYDKNILDEEDIKFLKLPAGKMRRYFSILNIFDLFRTGWGILKALFSIYLDFPDVIFAKGGYDSFPALVAAKLFKIPLIIHESDSIPGRVTIWASKFAARIAISYADSARFFNAEKVALTGNPIRRQVIGGNLIEANEIFNLEGSLDTILVLGGSQGAKAINDILVDILPELLKTTQVIHQTGSANLKEVRLRSDLLLNKSDFKKRYHVFGFLDEGAMRNASKVTTLAISRAGGAIFELAAWGLPCILIPLPGAAQDHQRENAYHYSREGAALVIEEKNLKPHLLLFEIQKILKDKQIQEKMKRSAESFAKIDAADKIAEEIIKLATAHA